MWSLIRRQPRQKKSLRCPPPSVRPRLEALEDRCLLSATGTLDPTFGSGGTVTTAITSGNDTANGVLLQSNGDIIAYGYSSAKSGNVFSLARYLPNGSLDSTFGASGIVTTRVSGDAISRAALQSDGKIVAAGNNYLVRYNSDGSLDNSFGSGGVVTYPTGFTLSQIGGDGAVLIQPMSDGSEDIVVAGETSGWNLVLLRYTPSGALDSSFGNGGEVVTNIAGGYYFAVNSLALENGDIVVGGGRNWASGIRTWVLARYTANGSLDPTFGNGGIVNAQVGTGGVQTYIASLDVQPADSKIVAVGDSSSTNGQVWGLARFNTDGSLDSTFGNGGTVLTSLTGKNDYAMCSALQSNGEIVAAGYGGGGTEVGLYHSDGSPDTSFGSGGFVVQSFNSGSAAYGVAVQPSDGKIVAAGSTTLSSGKSDFFLARYLGISTTFAVTGFPSTVTAGTTGIFTVTVKNADGSTDTGYTGTVHFTSSDSHAALPADYTFTAADQGVHTFSATLLTAGTQSLTATDTANGFLGSETGITVNPAAASTLSLTGFPSPTNAGSAGSFTVTALDPYGNQASGYTGTIHFTSSDPSAVLPADYTFTAGDNGTHTFSATLNTTGTQSLTATDTTTSSITGSQTGITVNPASLPATSLSVTGFPASITAGVAGNISVTARDANGNIATGYTGTVHFSSSDPLAVLPSDYTFTVADQGVHTFSITLKKAGSQSITTTDTATGSITGSESGIQVNPAAASQFVLSAPSSVKKGSAFSLTLTVEDAFGNVVTGYVGTVHFSSSDSTATLPADYTFTAGDNGVHTFTGAATLRKRGTQTITVTDTKNSALTATDSIQVS